MPRVTTVAKAQKPQGECRCGAKIEKGDPYRWWKFRYGGRRVRCMKPGCAPRGSDLTQSKLSGVYAAQEAAEDAISAFRGSDSDTADDLRGALEDAAGGIRDVGEEYRESAQNIESGFNHRTSMCDELEEKADTLDSSADELESAAGDLEDFDADAVEGTEDEELAEELNLPGHDDDHDDANARLAFFTKHRDALDKAKAAKVEEARQEWIDEQSSKAEDAVGNIEFP